MRLPWGWEGETWSRQCQGKGKVVLALAARQRPVEALEAKTCSLLSADINFNVSGLFSAPAPQDKVSDRPASEELPTIAVPTLAPAPAPAPAPASVPASAPMATKER